MKHEQCRWPILLSLVKNRFASKAKVNEKLLALMKPTGRGKEEGRVDDDAF